MRTCPSIYAMYITFWLGLGLSVLQVVLALGFLVWFLISLYRNSSTSDVVPRSDASFKRASTNSEQHRKQFRLSTTSSILSGYLSDKRLKKSDSLKSVRENHHCVSSYVRWLCFGGLCLAFLSAGLILGLVLVVGHINYFYSTFTTDLTSVFIEARVAFHSSPNAEIRKNSFLCWDRLQNYDDCCGLQNYTDWVNLLNGELIVPRSCLCTTCKHAHYAGITPSPIGPIYVRGCQFLIENGLLFSLSVTRVYMAVALGLIVLTFFADFGYTLFTAHFTLSKTCHSAAGSARELAVVVPESNADVRSASTLSRSSNIR